MVEIIPNWHPVLVHFTLALLSVSVLLTVLVRFLPDSAVRADWQVVARWCLWFGTGFAALTAFTGWLASNSVEHDDISHVAMTEHRDWALATLTLFVVLSAWSLWSRWRGRDAGQLVFVALMLLGGGLLASTGWHGGELVYRHGLGVMSTPMMRATAEDGGHAHGSDGHGEQPHAQPAGAAPSSAANTTPPAPVKKKIPHDHSTHKH